MRRLAFAIAATILWSTASFAQGRDSIYYKNFVYHANATSCTHTPPAASFIVWLNANDSTILTEQAPRWDPKGDPNIKGDGTFGVELANFTDPPLSTGDSLFIRFICSASGQTGILSDSVTGIPWQRFPLFLTLSAAAIPSAPANVALAYDSLHPQRRTISWTTVPGESYAVYRRAMNDTVPGGEPRMLYHLLSRGIAGGVLNDSIADTAVHNAWIVFAVSDSGVISPHSAEVNDAPVVPPGSDLTIGFIARLPRLNYVWASSEPQIDGWPSPGQTVTWHALVKNWGAAPAESVVCFWYLDTTLVQRDTVTIPAGDTLGVDYQWPWTFDRHQIRFVLDATNRIPEEEEGNNQLSVVTNAIGAGFYVEQSVYDYFHAYQKLLHVHSNCWEDWAQRHVARWNQMLANAVYPESPHGVTDRVRLDNITIVPDGALPLAGGLATNDPNMNDRTVDLQWGFVASGLSTGFYANHTLVSDNNPFYFEGSLFHELGHARYLIDVYGFNVQDDGHGSTLGMRENGRLAVELGLVPKNLMTSVQGLMNSTYTYIDRYSAAALNLIAGHRAVEGNYNAPGNIGIFMSDLPAENRLTVLDGSGNPLPNADVRIFRATGKAGEWYGKYFDSIPDLEFTTDDSGRVLLGRCPFSATGSITHDYGYSNGVIIVRVEKNGKVGYDALESMWFNLQYWSGHTTMGEYSIQVNLQSPTEVPAVSSPLPATFALSGNFPNPFNPATTVSISVSERRYVTVTIYNLLGQVTRVLAARVFEPGNYHLQWNAADMPSGVYLCRMEAGRFSAVQKMVLLK